MTPVNRENQSARGRKRVMPTGANGSIAMISGGHSQVI